MKIKIIIAIMLMALTCSVYGQQQPQTPVDKIPIKLDQDINAPGRERSINFSTIEAYFNPTEETIELSLLGIGEAEIYIVDMDGNICEEDSAWTDYPTTLTYYISHLHGTFRLIISSPTHYAEGYFTLPL